MTKVTAAGASAPANGMGPRFIARRFNNLQRIFTKKNPKDLSSSS
jgi:hypothetical protein